MQLNDAPTPHYYLTTSEVAAYLRLKPRKVYDLVSQGLIPCTKVTGKLLFPREVIDLWIMNHLEGDQRSTRAVPPIVAGSQDPLLDWALRESGAGLATLCQGSGDGTRRLLEGDAMVAGMHILDPESGGYNVPGRLGLGGMRDLVILRWARRRQGLLVAPANPRGIQGIADLARPDLRVAHRQPEAGADTLFRWLLQREGLDRARLNLTPHPALTEDDLALSVHQGEADAGLAVEAAARRHDLTFIPLHWECFDLAMRRRSYFEPAVQALMRFAANPRLQAHAEEMHGYDLSGLGRVVFNA
ncbi:excisionase family DNA binding protein [Alkalispirillum mobile]|uniref:Excisionase family DNA binding protein n=1 Tax=Alkalispirillum mobile TaxID=85925 RepID=A0A498C2L3_9GAMM|nr:helix-turn-helix transcriptional regulator [Alkalispirillum mobile]RLK47048.1 excisionase family DNA binding protein [Alkalispirillum mobile]